jgi:hypothetical protein
MWSYYQTIFADVGGVPPEVIKFDHLIITFKYIGRLSKNNYGFIIFNICKFLSCFQFKLPQSLFDRLNQADSEGTTRQLLDSFSRNLPVSNLTVNGGTNQQFGALGSHSMRFFVLPCSRTLLRKVLPREA